MIDKRKCIILIEFKGKRKLREKEATLSKFPEKTGRVCNFVLIVEALGK